MGELDWRGFRVLWISMADSYIFFGTVRYRRQIHTVLSTRCEKIGIARDLNGGSGIVQPAELCGLGLGGRLSARLACNGLIRSGGGASGKAGAVAE